MGAPGLVGDFLGVVAANGRTHQLPAIIDAFQIMVRRHQGIATAEVTVAQPLTEDQRDALATKLKARTGRQMDLAIRVDPAILGGIVVRIGSEQVDASVRTRLDRLGQQMKGL
jgi:F-type H+-transporting ATPase subunit delta